MSVGPAVLPMWPFKSEIGVSKLRDEVAETQRQLRTLKLDMDDLWDRFNRLSGKLAKRAAREETPTEAGQPGESEDGVANAPLSPTFTRLTPRQRLIQAQIMQRRISNGGK